MGWVQVAPSLRAWGGILPDRGLGMSACPVLLLSRRGRSLSAGGACYTAYGWAMSRRDEPQWVLALPPPAACGRATGPGTTALRGDHAQGRWNTTCQGAAWAARPVLGLTSPVRVDCSLSRSGFYPPRPWSPRPVPHGVCGGAPSTLPHAPSWTLRAPSCLCQPRPSVQVGPVFLALLCDGAKRGASVGTGPTRIAGDGGGAHYALRSSSPAAEDSRSGAACQDGDSRWPARRVRM